MKLFLFLFLLGSTSAFAGNVSAFSYSGTNVGTSAYVTAIASTPISVSKMQICDTSTKILKVAKGAAGAEIDLAGLPVSGCATFTFSNLLPAGTRISLEAIDASATAGYNVITLFP